MKRLLFFIVLIAALFVCYSGVFASEPGSGITLQADKTSLSNGGMITITGTAPAGKAVYIEVWSEKKVQTSRFDSDVDKSTGKRPYILYMTHEMPAYYKIFVPGDRRITWTK